jgi:O-antigen ligase
VKDVTHTSVQCAQTPMGASRWVLYAERACLTILFAWLVWLPLPFGSVVEVARLPLLLVPLALCTVAALLRLYATRDRNSTAVPTLPLLIWAAGALLFLIAGAVQLIPLPPALLSSLSPSSAAIWSDASRVITLGGVTPPASWPVTVDPQATAAELFRLAALAATFLTAALLIRSHVRRRVLAMVLCAAAVFEVLYGLREAALQRYEIWGWVNRLIFDRVTGTFVNPNHFAHYVAIVLPMALFLVASLWRRRDAEEMPFFARLAAVVERHALLGGFTLLAAAACLGGILLAQSRGALLALAAGIVAVVAMLPGRRVLRVAIAGVAAVVLVAALAVFLGTERTLARFAPSAVTENVFSRRVPMAAAVGLWQRFPVLGSGLGTFERVVWMEQERDFGHFYHHAHNDYLEVAATGGTVGVVIAVVALLAGYQALVRMTFGKAARELTWVRRAFQAAALASLTVAMVHALFDFNLFIPSNPPTLAAIVGAAVAAIDHDRRTRR